MPCITLLTDFGSNDEYVGVMKGVILTRCPGAAIVDITHQVAPHDVQGAAYALKAAFSFFPRGTVHVVVVDPGVGGERAIIALKTRDYIFLAPDNGVIEFWLEGAESLVKVSNRRYFLDPVSSTFHGRDIFAPVAAHLARGVALKELGPPIDKTIIKKGAFPAVYVDQGGNMVGTVIAVDRFGNLITDIDKPLLESMADAEAQKYLHFSVGSGGVQGLSSTYAAQAAGLPLALFGSRGYLEIAVNQGHAARYFNAGRGDQVSVSVAYPHPKGKKGTGAEERDC